LGRSGVSAGPGEAGAAKVVEFRREEAEKVAARFFLPLEETASVLRSAQVT
jgi:hypothetical protein